MPRLSMPVLSQPALSLAAISLLTVSLGMLALPHPAAAVEGANAAACRFSPPATSATPPPDVTQALQHAIIACSRSGGGQVVIPAGRYIIGPISLASRIDLHLVQGAVLEASPNHARYKAAYINWAYRPGEALISAAYVQDAKITGTGTIDGRGDTWWPAASADRDAGNPKTIAAGMPASNGLPRPWLIEAYHSYDVIISGVHITRSPMWTIALRYTDGATVSHVTISNPADSPNTDGIDVVAARNTAITDDAISTGDDNIALKSGLPGSPLPDRPTLGVHLARLALGAGHGLSVGSETLFGVEDVEAQDIAFHGTENGIRIKSGRDRGNILTGFHFTHITMDHVGTALSISAYYPNLPQGADPARPVTPTTPFISDVSIRDLRAQGVQHAGVLAGLPEAPLSHIHLTQIAIAATTPLVIRHAAVQLSQVQITGPTPPIEAEAGAVLTTTKSPAAP